MKILVEISFLILSIYYCLKFFLKSNILYIKKIIYSVYSLTIIFYLIVLTFYLNKYKTSNDTSIFQYFPNEMLFVFLFIFLILIMYVKTDKKVKFTKKIIYLLDILVVVLISVLFFEASIKALYLMDY